jgi:hypothetical protein
VLGSDRLGHKRAKAVGADHDASALDDGVTARTASYADRTSVLDQDFLDGESLAHFRACLGSCIDQQFVEDRPPRTEGDRCCLGSWRTRNREWAEIEAIGVDRRAAGCHQAVEQTPP